MQRCQGKDEKTFSVNDDLRRVLALCGHSAIWGTQCASTDALHGIELKAELMQLPNSTLRRKRQKLSSCHQDCNTLRILDFMIPFMSECCCSLPSHRLLRFRHNKALSLYHLLGSRPHNIED